MEELLLDVADNPASVTKTGDAQGELVAGRRLLIRAHAQGPQEEVLEYEVPVGKVATARVQVFITETDA